MVDPSNTSLRRQLQRQAWTLRTIIFSLPDPSINADLVRQLVETEKELHVVEQSPSSESGPVLHAAYTPPATHGRLLGPETTGLRVTPVVNMHPLPTGI